MGLHHFISFAMHFVSLLLDAVDYYTMIDEYLYRKHTCESIRTFNLSRYMSTYDYGKDEGSVRNYYKSLSKIS